MNNKHQSIVIYLLTFLSLSILLKLWGIIDFDSNEIFGYGLIFYGISLVYISFGNHQRGRIFIGTIIFLVGLILFIISRFEFLNTSELIIPSVLLIFSISFFMVFLDNTSEKTVLTISIIFFISGIIYTVAAGTINFTLFFSSLVEISLSYWPVLLIVAGIILIIHRSSRV